jgi:hypothetical protein
MNLYEAQPGARYLNRWGDTVELTQISPASKGDYACCWEIVATSVGGFKAKYLTGTTYETHISGRYMTGPGYEDDHDWDIIVEDAYQECPY